MKLNKDIAERALAYRKICESVNFIWPNRNFVIVCARPSKILRDESGRLHSETGNAIEYPDGWGLAAWHGTIIPLEWITKKSITPKDALECKNMEQRRAACEILGWHRILNELNAKIIDENTNPQIGTLYEVNLPDSPKEKFLKVLCGTEREFAINVDQKCKTALEAQQWMWQDDEYNPEVRS